ncbi:MAG: phosphatase PAP2 family protein [Gaiellaceae bacterium]
MDTSIAIWVATHRISALNDPMVWLGTIEKLGAVWIFLALVTGFLRRIGLWRTIALAVLTAITTFAADALAFGVKDLTSRTRPFAAHPQIHPLYVVHSSSFPAGHAATAFAGAVLLTAVVPRLWPAFFALAALIGFSRVYDGVHYPTDVLAGALLGAAVGGIAVLALRAPIPRLRQARAKVGLAI